MTYKLYINAYFIVSFAFPVNNSKLSNLKCAHGAQFKTQHSKFKIQKAARYPHGPPTA